jgi:hypothetical protein
MMHDMVMLRTKLDTYPKCRVVISREAAERIIERTKELERGLRELHNASHGSACVCWVVDLLEN